MIHFLAIMQMIFGRNYPFVASAIFAAVAAYYSIFHDTPDTVIIVCLAMTSSFAWLLLHGAESILFDIVTSMENASKTIEKILNQPEE